MANVPVITEPDWDGKTPYSRSEAILLSIINGTPIDTEKWEGIPLSRGEYLLLQLKDVIEDNSMLDFKGRVDSVNDLPSTGNKKGDVYSVGTESQLNRPEYFWTGTSWEYFGQIVDLSGYATLNELGIAIQSALDTVGQTYLKRTGGIITKTGSTTDTDGLIKFSIGTTICGYIGGVDDEFTIHSANEKNVHVDPGIDTSNIQVIYKSSGVKTTVGQIFANGSTMMIAAPGEKNTAVYGKNVSLNGTSVTINGPTSINGTTTLPNLALVSNNTYAGSISATQDGISVSGSRFSVSSAQTSILGTTGVSIMGGTTSVNSTNVTISAANATLNNNPLRATVLLTQAEYDALATKDPNVVYNIYEPDEEEGE